MLVSDFDFVLPKEQIAQFPLPNREEARMMILSSDSGERLQKDFRSFADYLQPGDCLVLNDTRVIPARLWARRPESGGRVQVFMLESRGDRRWQVFLKPGRRMRIGSTAVVEGTNVQLTVCQKDPDGACIVEFDTHRILEMLEEHGSTPLPPYINRPANEEDKENYQTVYAENPGSVACPTAGLHMTDQILAQLQAKGVSIARLTLHVGAGTFRPVESDTIEGHVMHEERYTLSEEAAEIINRTHQQGGKVFCMGTTSVRTIETCAIPGTNRVQAGSGRTSIFLHPPMHPQVADGLLTNFHLPKSTLIMLVCCFAGHKNVMAAYEDAVASGFRFFSYGDCMLVLPTGRPLQP